MASATTEVLPAPGVTEFQGIDVGRIKQHANSLTDETLKEDILELLEHVESDGLLDRISAARKHMAEQILPSTY